MQPREVSIGIINLKMMKGNCYYSVRLVVIIACIVWFENVNNVCD